MSHVLDGSVRRRDTVRRALVWAVALCHLLIVPFSSPAFAQSGDAGAADGIDREPPVIEFEPLGDGRRGDAQVFSVRVTDDVDVASVALRYRLSAEVPYRTATMRRLGGTDLYTVSLPGAETDVAAIQYYIVARDEAGNRSIEGFAFDPLERRLVDRTTSADAAGSAPTASEPTSPTVSVEGMSTGRKVLYGVLGVIAVGALAAAVGGGDGGDGGGPQADEPGGSDVPVTFVIDPP